MAPVIPIICLLSVRFLSKFFLHLSEVFPKKIPAPISGTGNVAYAVNAFNAGNAGNAGNAAQPYAAVIAIFLGSLTGLRGITTVRTPFLKLAFTPSAFTS